MKRSPLLREAVRIRRIRRGGFDYSDFAGSLRGNAKASGAEPVRVLIATGGAGYLAALQVESLLAAALTIRGAQCHVLLCDGILPACMQCTSNWDNEARYARYGTTRGHCGACFSAGENTYGSLGVPVHKLSEYLTPEQTMQAATLAELVPLNDIPSFEVEGIPVGEHAYAGALRFYARATLADKHSEQVLRRYLHAAILTASATQKLVRKLGINRAVLHHGIYVPQGVIAEVLRQESTAVTTWHVAYRRNTFIFSHSDTYHYTLMSEPVSSWENLPWSPELEHHTMAYLESRWRGDRDWIKFHRDPIFENKILERETGADFSKPTIGMLTNVMWDAQLHYPANAFPNMLEWALHTVRWFATRPDLQLIIRVHPAEVSGTVPSRQPIESEIREGMPELPPNVFIVPASSRLSTYALMKRCNAAIIYGTKTGVELAATGIPVIVAGEAWIRNKNITLDARTVDEYDALLAQLPLPSRMDEETIARARKYAFHFFFRRMIPLNCFRPTQGVPPFRVNVADMKEIAPGADRGLDVVCDGILTGSEFSYPAEEELAAAAAVANP